MNFFRSLGKALGRLRLSKSQIVSAVGGAAALAVSVNQHLPQVAALGVHIPAKVATGIQVAGVVATMLGRSLLPDKSGLETANVGSGTADTTGATPPDA